MQRFQTELLFDTTLPGLIETVTAADKEFNSGKLADGFFNFGHLKQKINLIGGNTVRAAEIVGLFYNTAEEDPSVYDHAAMQQKVYQAWRAVDRDFFSAQAWRLLLLTSTAYPPLPVEENEASTPTDAR
ncbi:hypothetical protein F0P96_10590 [Hymenobacter busanensis]|uniref:Uncharacterized protein n=1 Tax=Hymenobacter busanensis TaxID=2607656 RepID=A0AA88K5H8_9BACT|nr:hypothetical protein F0P96_10590 [Hymenobacter busanensis]